MYFKEIFFTTLNILIIFFAGTAFGLYNSIELDNNFNFEPQAFFKANLNEAYIPVLLFNDKEGYCVIPLDEQNKKKLNMQEILNQNSLDEAFAFSKQMTNLKLCEPEIAQIVMNSIDPSSNQLAVVSGAVVAGVIYVGLCSWADYITNKRYEIVGSADESNNRVSGEERLLRLVSGMVCFPVYGVGTLIRWYSNGGHDPLVD